MASKHTNMSCAGCLTAIVGRQHMQCNLCENIFDIICANISERRFLNMTKEQKRNWACQACKSKQPKGDNSNTPVRSSKFDTSTSTSFGEVEGVTANFVTIRRPVQSGTVIAEPSTQVDKTITRQSDADGSLRDILLSSIKAEIPSLLTQVIREELASFKDDLLELRKSVNFLSDMYDEMRETFISLSENNKKLKSENESLKVNFNLMSDRLNKMEQYLRDKNMEMKGVPEHPSENIPTLVRQCASVIGHKISDGDVVKCNRVAKQNKSSNVPRTIIVQFKSEKCRDEFFSAVSRYNKSNPDNKLNTALLGIAGEKRPVFISEHLSPQNQALHIATRKKAKEFAYKFVWVRGGRIFVRKDTNSQYIMIRDFKSLDLIT